MSIDRSRRPADIPAPPSVDEIAARLSVPLFTFSLQDAVEEIGAGWNGHTQNGRSVLQAATISCTLWRNPADRDDPINLAELTPEIRAALDEEPPSPLPEWMVRRREQMRYLMLWDAARTTHISDGSTWHTLELAFIEHINYIVMNTSRTERVRGGFPGELADVATADQIEYEVPVTIDGIEVDGMRYETDPHGVGVAADLGDRYLTAVIPRRELSLARLEFMTRPAPAETPYSRTVRMRPQKVGGFKRLLQQELLDQFDRFPKRQSFPWSVVELLSNPVQILCAMD